jgi:CO/xanthine dehydrogenase Mo-binding subunit
VRGRQHDALRSSQQINSDEIHDFREPPGRCAAPISRFSRASIPHCFKSATANFTVQAGKASRSKRRSAARDQALSKFMRRTYRAEQNRTQGIAGGADLDDRIQFAFGAQFVELHVHLKTREIRCPRILGAFAAGRIMNARTAPSQLMGGLIRGLSSALHEATEIDRRFARFTNTDLSDYMIPVNVDVGQVDVIIVPEEDRKLNDLGIKGLGELGNVGVNALFNATGVRVRDLPIRIEQFLGV